MFRGCVNYHDPKQEYEFFDELANVLAVNSPTPSCYSFNLVNGPTAEIIIQCTDGYKGCFDPKHVNTIGKVFYNRYIVRRSDR